MTPTPLPNNLGLDQVTGPWPSTPELNTTVRSDNNTLSR